MSFVYAINSVDFSIMSDTKIALNDELINLWNTENERRLIRQVGLIKAIIVPPNIVVCYAGNNIDKAAELLREINSVENNLEQIIEKAYEIHNNAERDDIEFIIGYCDKNRRELISIKDRRIVRDCKVYQSKANFCCYIYEDNLGIVYTDKEIYNQDLKGMKFPKLYKMDKAEFDLIAENIGAYSCFDLS